MDFTGLEPKHQAFVHLAQHCVDPTRWGFVSRILKECLILGAHEGADLDILIPAALFYTTENPFDKHLKFVQNLLESIDAYPHEKVSQVIKALEENCDREGKIHLSHTSIILHDAIILASLEKLYTMTAKTLVNKKAGLLRMLAQETRKKLFMR